MFLRPRLLLGSQVIRKSIRTFLSDQYGCTNEWNSRLQAPFMEKISLDHYYYELDQTLQQEGKISAVDLDMFVNKVTAGPEIHVDEMIYLLQRTRLTEEATNVLDSTGHAVIRNLVDSNNISEVLQILENRLTYGVFLDHYLASYLLDSLIAKNDFHSAARVATFLMLDEDFSRPLSRALSLYASYKYLEKCEPFYEELPPVEKETKPKKKDEVKVRVKFLRNEFFDDHFDLKNNKHLIGKTFVTIGLSSPDPLKANCKLLGYTLYQKYDKAIQALDSQELYKDVLDYCLKFSENIETDNTSYADFRTKLETLSKSSNLNKTNFESDIKALVESTIKQNETNETSNQKKVYENWNQIREIKLNEKMEKAKKLKRLKEIEKIEADLKSEEQKLWFFENEDNIDLQIDSKKVLYPKRWFGKKKKPRVVDEGYVPPEIVKQRR